MNIHKLKLLVLFFSFRLLVSDDKIDVKTTGNNLAAEEFKIKREDIFEFISKPKLIKQNDNFEITFETKGFCDVTIVIENTEGKIIRHLASGILGDKAPQPFQKNSKIQKIIWDGKNDKEEYVNNLENCMVRVSLGLKPQFEKNVLWSPYRRIGSKAPLMTQCDEGMLIFDGQGVDHLRLFDHEGNYKRTIYPFSAEKINKTTGLNIHEFPQDKKKLPLKVGHVQSTLLTSGGSSSMADIFGNGRAASTMTCKGSQIILAENNINWLSMENTDGKQKLDGPSITCSIELGTIHEFRGGKYDIGPRSMALSPDGKWLYLTCYFWSFPWHQGSLHGVARMPTDGSENPKLWKGSLSQTRRNGENWKRETGQSPADFNQPMSVACDAKGNVYVADYFNDRIQIFDQEGSFVLSIQTPKPTKVCINPKTNEIFVFSWAVSGIDWIEAIKNNPNSAEVPATLTQFGSIENPIKKASYELPLWWKTYESIHPYNKQKGGTYHMADGWWNVAEIDFKANEPTVWLIPAHPWNQKYDLASVKLYTLKEGKLVLKRDTGLDLKNKLPQIIPPPFSRQRMCINPFNGNLYVLEQENGTDKNFCRVTQYNPEDGKSKLIELPCHAEDMCFDTEGIAYLRVDQGIIRFESSTWKEIPWDYGEENPKVMFSGTSGGRSIASDSVLKVPGSRSNPFWHLGGISISPKGHLAVTTYNGSSKSERKDGAKIDLKEAKPYTPILFPGRYQWGEIHVFDKHGKVIISDAFPGIGHLDGVGIDKDDSIYVMVGSTRMINGKKYDNSPMDVTETLVKTKLNQAKVFSDGNVPLPLPKSEFPKRSADVSGNLGVGGNAWIENADWFYGGVGAAYSNQPAPSCCCWNSRFTIDLFGRSFAPEIRHSSVAVLDTEGNLILRVGKYGNIDEGKPLIIDPENPNPSSIGGDEVSLFYAPYVATHTDKRLYIADPGNGRIVCVKLNYHVEEKINLKDLNIK